MFHLHQLDLGGVEGGPIYRWYAASLLTLISGDGLTS